jgi:Tol biopolymer transport system component
MGRNREIYVMNSDGSNQIRLTNNQVDDSFSDWQPIVADLAQQSTIGGGATVVGGSLAPGGGQSILLPAAALLVGTGVLTYAVLRRQV